MNKFKTKVLYSTVNSNGYVIGFDSEPLIWLKENIGEEKDKWACDWYRHPLVIVIYFKNEEDAVHFKMVWS